MSDSRYPYTYACDHIRKIVGGSDERKIISRSDASRLRQEIAGIIGMDDHDLAVLIADKFKSVNKT